MNTNTDTHTAAPNDSNLPSIDRFALRDAQPRASAPSRWREIGHRLMAVALAVLLFHCATYLWSQPYGVRLLDMAAALLGGAFCGIGVVLVICASTAR